MWKTVSDLFWRIFSEFSIKSDLCWNFCFLFFAEWNVSNSKIDSLISLVLSCIIILFFHELVLRKLKKKRWLDSFLELYFQAFQYNSVYKGRRRNCFKFFRDSVARLSFSTLFSFKKLHLGTMWTGKNGSRKFRFSKIFVKNVCPHSHQLCWHSASVVKVDADTMSAWSMTTLTPCRRSCWLYADRWWNSHWLHGHRQDYTQYVDTFGKLWRLLTDFWGTLRWNLKNNVRVGV